MSALLQSLWSDFLAGEHAKQMESCTDDEVSSGVAALLAAFPAIPASAADSKPAIRRSGWGKDPLFRGSYTYVNAKGSPDDIDTLAAPLEVGWRRPFQCMIT